MKPDEVRVLVERARGAQQLWWALGFRGRRRALHSLRHCIVWKADEIADLIHRETGKPLADAMVGEVLVACDHLGYAARRARAVVRPRKVSTGWLLTRRALVEYEPYGVVAAITPWNYPFLINMSALASALAAGNAVVLKPSEATPLVGRKTTELVLEAIGIEDLVACATGDGSTGEALVRAGVDKVLVVGGRETGRRVMAAAAEAPNGPVPVTLELGGGDAMIVCADADIQSAARAAVWGAFYNCGQSCQGVERVYVEEGVSRAFIEAVVAHARRVRTGDEPESMMGPLVSDVQVEKVEAHLREARERGARILLGGRRIAGLPRFFEPTVVVDVPQDTALIREETFGPVLPILKVRNVDEAIGLANDSELGLSASVWSQDQAKARRIASALRVGSVMINDVLINYAVPGVPFGGRKGSGFGVVHGDDGIREFARPHGIIEPRVRFAAEPYWFGGLFAQTRWARAALRLRHGRGVRRVSDAWRSLRRRN
ncbi:MAG: aldehyde dehydrogenase family protein [Gemmatimonadetes bacterium]|nr:aldehyde dehydrogenase family protein [Gemmatimonadota bacterium]